MKKKFFILFLFLFLLLVIFSFSYYYLKNNPSPERVLSFGPLKVGDDMPVQVGNSTFAPWKKIPPAKFYIVIIQKELWCLFEECGPEGKQIAKAGGWLEGRNTVTFPDANTDFGLEENKDVKSITVVGDKKGKIVGIYPHATTEDLSLVLAQHTDLFRQSPEKIVLDEGKNTFTEKKYNISIQYPRNWEVQEISETEFNFIPEVPANGVLQVKFETTNEAKLLSWIDTRDWPIRAEAFEFRTSSLGISFALEKRAASLYALVKPGVIMSLYNGASFEKFAFPEELFTLIIEGIR